MFNRGGIDAQPSKPRGGRPRRIKLQKLHDILITVLGDPAAAGEVHWKGVKIHGWLKEQLATELGYRSTIRYLHELNYNLRVPQRWPEICGFKSCVRVQTSATLRFTPIALSEHYLRVALATA
jgi:transposase